MDQRFKLISQFKPAGDQPAAVEELARGVAGGAKDQVLLGVTGSGKTFVIANLIEKVQKPTLIISPNKVLAAQLYAEFKAFFPENAVEFFISYYDYYQPEAYVPSSDTYIEKDASINEHIEKLRLKATSSILSRRDVIIVASVSCIYNLGGPEDYQNSCILVKNAMAKGRETLIKELVDSHYERNDLEFVRGHFRVRGDTIEIFPAYADIGLRVEFFGDEIEKISEFNPIDGHILKNKDAEFIYPASHFVISQEKINIALAEIERELVERVAALKGEGKLLEAQRLDQRTRYDMEMMRLTGVCAGIENYSRILSDRAPGTRPECLMDYFNATLFGNKNDFMVIIDESHITVPQIRGMYAGDRARKETLVKYGFRLPSALDNRPLKFDEFEKLSPQTIYASATPGPYELTKTGGAFTELVIRPTGLVDPAVEVRPIKGQIDDLIVEIRSCVAKKYRVLVTTLTKRLSEDLAEYLKEKDMRVQYLHSEIDALSRIEILKNLRQGKFDVLVGINLLREGLDLPEVGLVAVLDADKEGFLRSETTLIQICGRAARNVDGKVILYADVMTGSMQRALGEMSRRRIKQIEYNKTNNITPKSIVTAVHDLQEFEYHAKEEGLVGMFRETEGEYIAPKQMHTVIGELENQMKQAADNLDFETAAIFRDRIVQLKEMSAQKKTRRNPTHSKK